MKRRLSALLLVAFMATFSTGSMARDVQWVLRGRAGDRFDPPIAAFLSSNFGAVIFRATCDPKSHELALDYFGDGVIPLSRKQTLILIGDGAELKLKTRFVEHRLEGRSAITPKLKQVLSGSSLDIDAPNEASEPWHVGKAAVLSLIVNACR